VCGLRVGVAVDLEEVVDARLVVDPWALYTSRPASSSAASITPSRAASSSSAFPSTAVSLAMSEIFDMSAR
jgi:hypothetical protein